MKDELVKRLLKSLPKTWRSTIVAIREAKDLNKIFLDKIYGSFLAYEQEVNQIDKEEKKKGIALKMSSKDEDEKMAMLARKYKKLAFQRDQRIGRRNF